MTRSWTEVETDEAEPTEVGSRTALKQKVTDLMKAQDIPTDRRDEVLNTLILGKRRLKEIVVPREEIVVLTTRATPEEIRRTVGGHTYSRFPLVMDSLEEILGTIYVPALLAEWEEIQRGEISIEELAAPPVSVPADMPISTFIDHLQETHQEVAMVE